MAHGIGGIRTARLDAFAERFSRAGLAVLAFDYRHLGTSEGDPRGLIDIRKQRDDYRAAVAFARGLDGIDPERIALWGASFSAGHVLTLAAEDDQIAAAVLTNPYVDGPAGIGKAGRVTRPRVRLALARALLVDEFRRLRGQPPHRIDLAGPPGSVALMTTPDAVPGFDSILPRERPDWEPAVPARILLGIATDRPSRQVHAVRCPLLVCVCDHDQIAPIGPAVRVGRQASHGELRRYALEHFEVFTGDGFEQVVRDQTGFLRRTLVGRGCTAPDG